MMSTPHDVEELRRQLATAENAAAALAQSQEQLDKLRLQQLRDVYEQLHAAHYYRELAEARLAEMRAACIYTPQ